MPDSLIVVESPTKIKTLKRYLSSNFTVKASVGHIKDLPRNKLGIDIEHNFEPTYDVIKEKKKVISDLKNSAKNVTNIYLASDPDREGEAIAWHVSELINGKNKNIYRVLFNDLTKNTILNAIKNPQKLDKEKYEAQKTRRILDRLVGYQISPLLWEKVRRGLSAGRVQSVAVRIVCDREAKIKSFITEEYWSLTASVESKTPPPFEVKLTKITGKKAKITNETQIKEILKDLEDVPFIVGKVEKKEAKRSPSPPFTTSKLQQEAARKFRFSAKRTMIIAQKLYEGIELGKEGSVGLITYMRTDSVRIAEEALNEVRNYITENYDKAFLPSKVRVFKSSKSAQEAHEAIRPASMNYRPKDIQKHLSADEFRLYQLIWNRFVASQMNPAIFDQSDIDVSAGDYLFHTRGFVMRFPGFTTVYTEVREEKVDESEIGNVLPDVATGEELSLLSLNPQQHFTQPPARFSEATLVKELEEKGIGRPSTYATIISTIQDRGYAKLEKGRFHPTELGLLVNELLVKNFPQILDIQFTASMENKLDLIEEGKLTRDITLTDFYVPFELELKTAKAEMRNIKKEEIPTDILCDKCGNPMIIKWGKNGKFLACSNYPECKNTSNFIQDETGKITIVKEETIETDITCDKCGKNMIMRQGKFGRFLGCSGYPECKNTMAIDIGVGCPIKGCGGKLREKRTKKGKIFFGCSNYPECTYALWDKPVPEECPLCGHPFLVEKYYRGKGNIKVCPDKECSYREDQE